MASDSIGARIKEARLAAGLTQEKLARQVDGVTAADISKAERGEISLSREELKRIAKATGVTQASLLEAAKASGTKKAAKEKAAGTKKTTKSTKTTKKATTKTPAGANTSMKVTATEKKLIEAYRAADSDLKKIAMNLLKGQYGDQVHRLLGGTDAVADLLGEAIGNLLGGK